MGRYYEKVCFLLLPPRAEGGRRLYSGHHLKRLAFQVLGFNLDAVRKLLGLVEGGYTCAEVQQAVGDHLKVIHRHRSGDAGRGGSSL